MMPQHLYYMPNNQIQHDYRGGRRIRQLRRGGPMGSYFPEEWIASTTARFGDTHIGLSAMPDGSLLRDLVVSDPIYWLGPEHVAKFDSGDSALLVKLLDINQRLPIHFHPSAAFAWDHLGLAHGKAEAWIILEAGSNATFGLGFTRAMAIDEVRDMVRRMDSQALIASLNTRNVSYGDCIFIPPGCPHYLSSDILLLEVQEPTDLSIFLEWEGLKIDGFQLGHLGLGFDTALRALDLSAWSGRRVADNVIKLAPQEGLVQLLPSDADPYFRAHFLAAASDSIQVPAGFAVLLAIADGGHVQTAVGENADLRRGDAVLLPWGAGDWTWSGAGEGILCRPPAPNSSGLPKV